MSELNLSDNDLLSLTEDEQTGVPYIATGLSPYYLQFRRMLYRILANLAPLGLRVYKTADLAVRVKPGRYWLAGQRKNFAGSAADTALTDDATNYVWLDAAGAVQASAAGWPAGAEYVPLATVVTAAGTFEPDDIADFRGEAVLSSLAGLTATVAELNDADISARTQDVIQAGPIDLSARHVRLTGPAAGTYAITLAAPDRPGIIKAVEMVATTATNPVTLALTNVIGGSAGAQASFNAAGETLVLLSLSGKWLVLAEHGVTLS